MTANLSQGRPDQNASVREWVGRLNLVWFAGKYFFWYFIAILVSVFVLQVYTLIRRIAENAKGND
jgi:hypothetical protein